MQGVRSIRDALVAVAVAITAALALAGAGSAQEPTYTQPTYTEPTYTEPTYTEPTYTEPTTTEPTTTEPTGTEPTSGEAPAEDPKVDVNGCGSKYFNVPDRPGGFDFHEACNKHDKCYATKGKTQKECDDQFYEDLKAKCASYTGKMYDIYGWKYVRGSKPPKFERYVIKTVDFTPAVREACLAWAKLYYEGVQKGGKAAYDAAQKKAAEGGGEEGGGGDGALSYEEMPTPAPIEIFWEDSPMLQMERSYTTWTELPESTLLGEQIDAAYAEASSWQENEYALARQAEYEYYMEQMQYASTSSSSTGY